MVGRRESNCCVLGHGIERVSPVAIGRGRLLGVVGRDDNDRCASDPSRGFRVYQSAA